MITLYLNNNNYLYILLLLVISFSPKTTYSVMIIESTSPRIEFVNKQSFNKLQRIEKNDFLQPDKKNELSMYFFFMQKKYKKY